MNLSVRELKRQVCNLASLLLLLAKPSFIHIQCQYELQLIYYDIIRYNNRFPSDI